MPRKELEMFEKIVSHYGIAKATMYDIAKAISVSESFGSHPISLRSLASSGISYFADIAIPSGEPLPKVRLMRLMCDSLAIALYLADKSLVSQEVLDKMSKNTVAVLDMSRSTDYYKSVEECEEILRQFEASAVNDADVARFVEFVGRCPYKASFEGLELDSRYKSSFTIEGVSFASTGRHFLDSLTEYFIRDMLKSENRFYTALQLVAKVEKSGFSGKFFLKADIGCVSDKCIRNALKSVFDFSVAEGARNLRSVELLYALCYLKIHDMCGIGGILDA